MFCFYVIQIFAKVKLYNQFYLNNFNQILYKYKYSKFLAKSMRFFSQWDKEKLTGNT